ncbi:MAG: hypothetical protein PHW96_03270 [Candidatus Nanoarchaeia archaeon]|nr:hypothetical protein [Candidatus Nanoarchaeia archaeon]
MDIGGRVIGSFLLLFFLLVVFNTLVNEELLNVIGLQGLTHEQALNFLNFVKPLLLLGIFIVWSAMMFGKSPVTAMLFGLFGIILYSLFNSQQMYTMIGLTAEQTANMHTVMTFLGPAIISGIMIGVIALLLKTGKAESSDGKIQISINTNK